MIREVRFITGEGGLIEEKRRRIGEGSREARDGIVSIKFGGKGEQL